MQVQYPFLFITAQLSPKQSFNSAAEDLSESLSSLVKLIEDILLLLAPAIKWEHPEFAPKRVIHEPIPTPERDVPESAFASEKNYAKLTPAPERAAPEHSAVLSSAPEYFPEMAPVPKYC